MISRRPRKKMNDGRRTIIHFDQSHACEEHLAARHDGKTQEHELAKPKTSKNHPLQRQAHNTSVQCSHCRTRLLTKWSNLTKPVDVFPLPIPGTISSSAAAEKQRTEFIDKDFAPHCEADGLEALRLIAEMAWWRNSLREEAEADIMAARMWAERH